MKASTSAQKIVSTVNVSQTSLHTSATSLLGSLCSVTVPNLSHTTGRSTSTFLGGAASNSTNQAGGGFSARATFEACRTLPAGSTKAARKGLSPSTSET